jgi:hypothetical protein
MSGHDSSTPEVLKHLTLQNSNGMKKKVKKLMMPLCLSKMVLAQYFLHSLLTFGKKRHSKA